MGHIVANSPLFMITLVSYMVLGVAGATGQASTSAPVSQPPPQQTSKPSPVRPSEIRQLQTKAETGDARAQATLGKAYQDGNGVTQNDALALTCSHKAAEQGGCVPHGEGVARDKEEAVRWFRKSVKQEIQRGRLISASYYNGDGVAAYDVASFAWFLLAQETGNPAADEALKRAASEAASQKEVVASTRA
jgi:Sel1 repeat